MIAHRICAMLRRKNQPRTNPSQDIHVEGKGKKDKRYPIPQNSMTRSIIKKHKATQCMTRGQCISSSYPSLRFLYKRLKAFRQLELKVIVVVLERILSVKLGIEAVGPNIIVLII